MTENEKLILKLYGRLKITLNFMWLYKCERTVKTFQKEKYKSVYNLLKILECI